ncbi:MAG TPA: hypothetical protein PLL71_05525 [Agriterribacter sp.]|nr:hypothetical protein [Agriterribacter sp.]HRQ51364.1 hypothetical protein [Agriterribacter sp.]
MKEQEQQPPNADGESLSNKKPLSNASPADSPQPYAGEAISNEQNQPSQEMEPHVHAHTHHDKKWKDYLLEFLMIFLAVTLGFFAESYREHSVEKARARQYAGALIHDLEKDTAMVGRNILLIGHITARIDSFANFLRGKKIGELDNRTLFFYTEFGYLYRPYTWSRATLQEIKSSGSLRYFANDSIIMKISAYDALTMHLDEDFNSDAGFADRISEKRNHIVDMNYSFDSPPGWQSNRDSLLTALLNKEIGNHGDLQLLTGNIYDIRSLLNDLIVIKRSLITRGNYELPNLIKDAGQLISILKAQYHL